MSLFEIKGGREVRAALKRIGKAADRAALKAVAQAMVPLYRRAVEEAPKDTGNLAAHIFLEVTEKKGEVSAEVGVRDVPYANPLHHGAPAKNIPADPFLTRAFDAEGKAVHERVRSILSEAILS